MINVSEQKSQQSVLSCRNQERGETMKAFSTVLFIIGLIMVGAGMWLMKSLNYLIPSIIGVIGLMFMWISADLKEELTNTDN